LYGFEELRESNKMELYSHLGLSPEMSETNILVYCKKIATEIEASMFYQYKGIV
jgi:hypothetical protein